MKILISMLATSKYENRLRLLNEGTIRSKSGQHELCFNLIADGERPNFLDKKFNWIRCDDIFISHRTLYGLERALECDDWDYVIMCDDDCVIDVDQFVQQNQGIEKGPSIWTTHPGMNANLELANVIRKHAGKFVNTKIVNDLYMGFCTSIFNKSMMNLIKSNRDALKSTWKISEELWGSHMVGDCQTSVLAYLLDADHIRGQVNNGTCWPSFMSSSLLCTTGTMWHVHGLRESKEGALPCFKQNCLINLVKNCPMNRDEMMTTWFDTFQHGFKARDWSDKPVYRHRHLLSWIGWRHSKENIIKHEEKTIFRSNSDLKNSGTIFYENRNFNWEACDGGLRIFFGADKNHGSMVFRWFDPNENAIFGINEQAKGGVNDSDIWGFWMA